MYLFQSVPASHDHVCLCVRCMSNWNKSHTNSLMCDCAFNQMSRRKICHRIQSNRKYLSLPFDKSTWTKRWRKPQPHIDSKSKQRNEKNFQTITSHLSYHKITVNELPSNVNAEQLLRVYWYTRETAGHRVPLCERDEKLKPKCLQKLFLGDLFNAVCPPMHNDDSVDIRSLQELKNNVIFMRNRDKSAAHICSACVQDVICFVGFFFNVFFFSFQKFILYTHPKARWTMVLPSVTP